MKRLLSGMISLLLAAFLAIMLLPGSGANADIVESGTCGADGDNITWALDSEGILTIQGSGKMKDWKSANDPSPWYRCADVKTVVIGKGVTSIGFAAFFDCENLKDITIPDSVTSIGASTFECCYNLESIIIPDSVTSIGESAFADCYKIESITIPDSVTSIGVRTFFGCYKLESITIPDSVTSIGEYAFAWCEHLESIIIPDSVTSIGESTFEGCSGLESITIPDSVTSIGNGAFEYCYNLESVILPDSVTSISEYTFYSCTELKEITIPDSVTSIGESAFRKCYILESITIPDSVTSIGNNAFAYCEHLESITIPDSVTSIGDFAFKDCTYLTKIVLPDRKDTIVQYSAFDDCPMLKQAILNEEWAASNSDILNALYDRNPEFTLYFYYDVYYDPEITGKNRSYMDDILEIEFTINNIYIDYIDELFLVDSKGNKTKISPDENGKYLCTMPDSEDPVRIIATYILNNECGEDAKWILDSEGTLFIYGTGEMDNWNFSETNLPPWYGITRVKKVLVGEGITTIGDYAFSYCPNICEINIPDSVTSIGDCAFRGCTGLNSLTIPDSVTSIGDSAFRGCIGLNSITIPDSITTIDKGAFKGCTGLKSITIPGSVKTIGNDAFAKCSNLTEAFISDGVESIGDGVFYDCTALKSITIPGSVKTVGNDAFAKCSSLTEAFISDGVESIGDGAFYDCTALKSITIPGSVKTIGNDAFVNCKSLAEVIIFDGVETIGAHAFDTCFRITKITIPDSVTSIGDDAFYACTGIKEIVIPENVISLGERSFYWCTDLEKVTVSDNNDLKVGPFAFGNCRDLKIVILNSEAEYDPDAFFDCPEGIIHYYYDVAYSSTGSGTVTGKARSYIGDKLELTIEPDDNYEIDKVSLFDSSGIETEILSDTEGNYSYTMPDSEGSVEFNVSFKLKQKEVAFCINDGDNTIELQKSGVDMTANPIYSGDLTIRPTNEFTYTITGWTDGKETFDKDDVLPAVYDDVTYYAVYEKTKTTYEIRFVDENGEELQSDVIEYGKTPVYTGKEPSKAEDDKYIYTFKGWTPEITEVTGEATYSPVFTSKEKQAVVSPEIKEPEPSFEAFVERMYVVVLDRPSEPEGKAFWSEKVENGELTGADCARNFLLSKEFKDKNLSDEEFVKVLYKAFFDRDASSDPDGSSFWLNSIKAAGRDAVVDGFINSPEWCNICASFGIRSGATTAKATVASANATAFAARLYTECLGREPEADGLKFWSLGLTNLELTGSAAAREFFFCKEFNDHNFDNRELISRMYKTFMGREADEDGLKFWMDSMDKGLTKEQLFDSFVNSKEFSDICISYAIDR